MPNDAIFGETLACYRAAVSRLPWMSVASWSEWSAKRIEWQEPGNAIILWWWNYPGLLQVVPPQRKASLALWYGESVGPPEKLCPHQRGIFSGLEWYFRTVDLVLVGSPLAARFLAPRCKRVAYAPIGYDPKIMGTPDWSAPKEYDFGYCGFPIGRREWIVPALKRRFGKRFLNFFGPSRLERKRIYDRCRAVLYIPHSEEPSLPGLRIWQSIASSAPLITEKRDCWPAVPGKHYIEVPETKIENVDRFVDQVERALKLPLMDIARRAHDELSVYTADRAMSYITAAI